MYPIYSLFLIQKYNAIAENPKSITTECFIDYYMPLCTRLYIEVKEKHLVFRRLVLFSFDMAIVNKIRQCLYAGEGISPNIKKKANEI